MNNLGCLPGEIELFYLSGRRRPLYCVGQRKGPLVDHASFPFSNEQASSFKKCPKSVFATWLAILIRTCDVNFNSSGKAKIFKNNFGFASVIVHHHHATVALPSSRVCPVNFSKDRSTCNRLLQFTSQALIVVFVLFQYASALMIASLY